MQILSDTQIIREALRYLMRWQGKTLLMATAPIGSVYLPDLELLAEDIKLLRQIGLNVCFAVYSHESQYKQGLASVCEFVEVADQQELVRKALELSAAKICLLCGADRIHTSEGALDYLSVAQAQRVISDQADLSEPARATLKLAVLACQRGIPRVHLFNAHNPGSLLEELFTGRGAGVMVYGETSQYKQTRRAREEDVSAIAGLLHLMGRPQTEKSLEFVFRHISDFVVFTIDNEVYGCAQVSRVHGDVKVHNLAHTSRFDASETLQGILGFALEEACSAGAGRIMVPASDLPPLMAIMPCFSRLGFRKENEPSGQRMMKVWTKRLRD